MIKIAALTMGIALLAAAPVAAQVRGALTPEAAAAPQADANTAPQAARSQSSAAPAATARKSSTMQAVGTETGTGTLPLGGHDPK
jgi:hypothetical protein